jgi:hypothetical protein
MYLMLGTHDTRRLLQLLEANNFGKNEEGYGLLYIQVHGVT